MRPNFISLIGVAFLTLALLRAVRVRRDLASAETSWDRALFGKGETISRAESPIKYWSAIVANIAIVFLLALVGAVSFRALSFEFPR
jgi:hypothetical protein